MHFLLAAALALAIDTDGMIKINGDRTFFVGLYEAPKIADPLPHLRAAGFNLVHAASLPALQAAGRQGLYAWSTTGTLDAKNEAEIRRKVTALKNEPALILWEIEDEPTFVWKKPLEIRTPPERIIATRQLIQSIDPTRLFYLNQAPTNLVKTLQRYNPGTDVIATDVYPVIPRGIRESYALWPDGQQGDLLNESISQVGQYVDKMRQVAGPAKPVFMILQGFAWETIQKQPDPKMILYPTVDQTRFMAFQSIVHGANGILFWGLHLGPANNPAWQSARAVAAELKPLAKELAARPLPTRLALDYHDTGHSLDRGLAYILKPAPDGAVLFVVNEDKNPIDVTISGLDAYKSCTDATLANGAFREQLPPFGARLYHCSR